MGWEKRIDSNIRTIGELKKFIKLSRKEEGEIRKVVRIHPMNISKYYMSLINKRDPKDPIRKMIVPSGKELSKEGEYDTSGEKVNTKSVGLQHKYRQTALLLATNRCGSYCRFCFRKRLVGLSVKEILSRFDSALEYIKRHREINNVLITGGDPFILSTKVLEEFLRGLSGVDHLDFVRFGTRTPVTFPHRMLDDIQLTEMLYRYNKRKRIYIVTHFNHPREITPESTRAIQMLINANLVVSNQTVLLRGVNDKPETLAELMNSLTRIGVVPYYVFQCRPVKRVKTHFQVPLYRGLKVVEDAKAKLNGHGKRFKFAMSHRSGKIEILGVKGNRIYFKQHQGRNPKTIGRFFSRRLNKTGAWLDDFK